MKTIIVYGSTTGNTEDAANLIGNGFKDAVIQDVADYDFNNITDFDLIILGTATAGAGDLQDEWEDKIDLLDIYDLSDKTIAIFGTGDQEGYTDTFAGSLNYIYEKVENSGAKLIGRTSTEGYEFEDSASVRGDEFIGLVLDEENQAQFTDQRVKDWVVQLISEIE